MTEKDTSTIEMGIITEFEDLDVRYLSAKELQMMYAAANNQLNDVIQEMRKRELIEW